MVTLPVYVSSILAALKPRFNDELIVARHLLQESRKFTFDCMKRTRTYTNAPNWSEVRPQNSTALHRLTTQNQCAQMDVIGGSRVVQQEAQSLLCERDNLLNQWLVGQAGSVADNGPSASNTAVTPRPAALIGAKRPPDDVALSQAHSTETNAARPLSLYAKRSKTTDSSEPMGAVSSTMQPAQPADAAFLSEVSTLAEKLKQCLEQMQVQPQQPTAPASTTTKGPDRTESESDDSLLMAIDYGWAPTATRNQTNSHRGDTSPMEEDRGRAMPSSSDGYISVSRCVAAVVALGTKIKWFRRNHNAFHDYPRLAAFYDSKTKGLDQLLDMFLSVPLPADFSVSTASMTNT